MRWAATLSAGSETHSFLSHCVYAVFSCSYIMLSYFLLSSCYLKCYSENLFPWNLFSPYVGSFFFYEHQRPSYGHQMNNNKVEQRENSFLRCQKWSGERLWCWARLMERLFDFWRDWRQHIGPCAMPKWHGQHQRLPGHTATRLFLWTLLFCCRLRPSGPMFPGCGLWTWPRRQEGRGEVQRWLASLLGEAVDPTIWPVSLSLNCSWPLYCLVASSQARDWEYDRVRLRKRVNRGEGGGYITQILALTLVLLFSLLQQQVRCVVDLVIV